MNATTRGGNTVRGSHHRPAAGLGGRLAVRATTIWIVVGMAAAMLILNGSRFSGNFRSGTAAVSASASSSSSRAALRPPPTEAVLAARVVADAADATSRRQRNAAPKKNRVRPAVDVDQFENDPPVTAAPPVGIISSARRKRGAAAADKSSLSNVPDPTPSDGFGGIRRSSIVSGAFAKQRRRSKAPAFGIEHLQQAGTVRAEESVECEGFNASVTTGVGSALITPRRRFAIVSLAAPGAHGLDRRSSIWMTNFTIANKLRYARFRGYDLHIHGSTSLQNGLPPSWSKIKLIRRYLLDYDYVVWVDADVLFMNFTRRFEDILLLQPFAEVLLASDSNGINCGVMIFRSTSRVMSLLDTVWHYEGDKHHIWQEQHALADILAKRPQFDTVVSQVPQRALNAYPSYAHGDLEQWQDGDLLVHFVNCDSQPQHCYPEFRRMWDKWSAAHSAVVPKVTRGEVRRAGPLHLVHAVTWDTLVRPRSAVE